jgi:L-amino acid N-acyltransferase YncA
MITYKVEKWHDCWRDLAPMWRGHWNETGLHRDVTDLGVDIERYNKIEDAGALQVLVAREDGKAIGYHLCLICSHPHYYETVIALTDTYFLHPDYRKGMIGIKMLREVERILFSRGVKKLFIQTRVADPIDHSRIFEFLGYEPTEKVFGKVLHA